MNLERFWINQPSSRDSHHRLHGQRVLAVYSDEDFLRVYFTEGPVVSQLFPRRFLAKGWPTKKPTAK